MYEKKDNAASFRPFSLLFGKTFGVQTEKA